MKKIMWIVAMIPVVVTSVVLQFMPDIIPMHHDLEGNTDRLIGTSLIEYPGFWIKKSQWF